MNMRFDDSKRKKKGPSKRPQTLLHLKMETLQERAVQIKKIASKLASTGEDYLFGCGVRRR